MKIISNPKCIKYHGTDLVKASILCAQGLKGEGYNICTGDSGGPLVVEHDGKKVLVGVVSSSPSRCASERPSTFTRVSEFLKWIQDNTK